MDMISVTIDAGDVHRVLNVYLENLEGLDMGVLAEEAILQLDNKIQAEGALFGYARWQELAESTKQRNPSPKMLQETGLLANFQYQVLGTRAVEVRSPAPYAGFHVTGTFTREGDVRMARRDFFELDYDQVLEGAGARVLERLSP